MADDHRQRVRTGLEVLLQDKPQLLRGRRVGLLTNATAVAPDLRHACELLLDYGIRPTRLFGPEHGIDGEAQDMIGVDSELHPRFQIPIVSLYGATAASLKPRPESLADLDVLVIDLQDIGSRYYTYVWTAVLAIEACAAASVEVVVCDRPNPLGGVVIEGPTLQEGFESFVGLHPLPVRHGLTIGELVRLVAAERGLQTSLQVIPLQGWRRELHYDQLALPWVLPSPNMPTLDTAFVYPGGCLLEGTNLSEGRGTARPFEIFGAPWVVSWQLAAALAGEDLPGVRFRPLSFSPAFHKHAGQRCGGVQLHVTDRQFFRSLRTGLAVLVQLQRLWPEAFGWRLAPYEFVSDLPAIDLLAGGKWLRQGIEAGEPLAELTSGWEEQERAFAQRRQPYLLY